MEDIIGYAAGTLTTISFIPQAIKVLRDKNVEGLSLGMYVTFSIGVALWLVYGITISNYPMTVFNVITFALSIVILFNIIKYRKS